MKSNGAGIMEFNDV